MKNNLAIMLIDMQPRFLENHEDVPKKEMINAQIKVLNYCLEQNLPVITLEYRGNFGATIPELSSIVKKPQNITFDKRYENGLSNKKIVRELNKLDINILFLMGINKSGCVKKTAKGALDDGFKVISSPEVINNSYFKGEEDETEIDEWYKENTIYLSNWKDIKNYHIPTISNNSKPKQ